MPGEAPAQGVRSREFAAISAHRRVVHRPGPRSSTAARHFLHRNRPRAVEKIGLTSSERREPVAGDLERSTYGVCMSDRVGRVAVHAQRRDRPVPGRRPGAAIDVDVLQQGARLDSGRSGGRRGSRGRGTPRRTSPGRPPPRAPAAAIPGSRAPAGRRSPPAPPPPAPRRR